MQLDSRKYIVVCFRMVVYILFATFHLKYSKLTMKMDIVREWPECVFVLSQQFPNSVGSHVICQSNKQSDD